MRRLLPLTLLLAGCFGHDVVPTAPPDDFVPALDPIPFTDPTDSPDPCGAEDARMNIGQPVSVLPASGPWKTLRILHPGQAATMDFSETRLTVLVDAQDRITDARCE